MISLCFKKTYNNEIHKCTFTCTISNIQWMQNTCCIMLVINLIHLIMPTFDCLILHIMVLSNNYVHVMLHKQDHHCVVFVCHMEALPQIDGVLPPIEVIGLGFRSTYTLFGGKLSGGSCQVPPSYQLTQCYAINVNLSLTRSLFTLSYT